MSELLLNRKINNINNCFSRYARGYDDWAQVQQIANQKTLDWFANHCKNLPEPVLELGCGTGDFTSKILENFDLQNITISDISEEMLNVAYAKLNGNPASVTTRCEDAAEINDMHQFRGIISTLALQWVENSYTILQRIHHTREKGDVVLLSWFNDDSFPEWKSACTKLNLPFTGNQLPPASMFHELMLENAEVPFELRHQSFELPARYTHPIAFFRSIKMIGAGATKQDISLSPADFKKLMNELSNPEGITITWNVDAILIKYDV